MVSLYTMLAGVCMPLNACQNRSHIICGTPPVLQDIQAQLSRTINIRVKHLTDEFDTRWFIRILLFEVHD